MGKEWEPGKTTEVRNWGLGMEGYWLGEAGRGGRASWSEGW